MFTNQMRLDLLVTALEGGSNYWYYLPDLSMCDKYKIAGDSTCDYIMRAIIEGESIPVHDIEDTTKLLGKVSLKSIELGEKLLEKNYPEIYYTIKKEDFDADSADVWFQLCLMGEVVYG